jgi:hypothetical protein
VVGCLKSARIIYFEGNLCYLIFGKAIGLKKRNFFVIEPRMESSKTIFLTAETKPAA